MSLSDKDIMFLNDLYVNYPDVFRAKNIDLTEWFDKLIDKSHTVMSFGKTISIAAALADQYYETWLENYIEHIEMLETHGTIYGFPQGATPSDTTRMYITRRDALKILQCYKKEEEED